MTQSAPTVLYLTRFYLPAAAAAGLRADHFVKALSDKSLRVIVATVGDQAELIETSDNLIVCRITENGRVPDRMPSAHLTDWPRFKPLPTPGPDPICSKAIYRVGQWLIKLYQPELIFATGLPFGFVAVGCRLAQKFQLPLVAEFRDCWFTGMPWPYPSFIQKRRAKNWEKVCVSYADKIITETQAQKNILDQAYPNFASKIVTIRHSFDPSIVPPASSCQSNLPPVSHRHDSSEPSSPLWQKEITVPGITPDRPFIMAYTGQLRGLDLVDQPWGRRLSRRSYHFIKRLLLGASFCENLRLDWMSPHYLMQALAQIITKNPAWRDKIKLIFVGQRLPRIDHWARRLHLAGQVQQLGPQPPAQAQHIIQEADLLILNLYGIKNLDYHWCVPAKTYAYLGSGKPVLALIPPGEARDLLIRARTGFVVPPDDINAIARRLTELLQQHFQGGIKINPNLEFINRFALPVQQKQFADLIISVINPGTKNISPRQYAEKRGQEPFLCAASPES